MTALATDSGRKTPARLAGSAVLALQSDERLVSLARSGHERAFEAIVDRYRRPLERYCRRILPESRTEDAVQQTFINAHAALLESAEAVQLKPWLFTIARNASLNMLRQNGWNYEQIPLDFDGVRRPDQIFEQRTQLQETVSALNDLPERQRSAMIMREFEGRSYEEIAVALDANDGAVRQLLNRARGALRTAATALLPPPIVARLVSSAPPEGRAAAEIIGSIGAAGIAKAGATALVAGSLVVGAVNAPLPVGNHDQSKREKATLSQARPAREKAAAAVAAQRVAARKVLPSTPSGAAEPQTAGPRRSTRVPATAAPVADDHSGSGREGADDRTRERSGSGDDSHSGSGRSGSDDDTVREDSSGPGSGEERAASDDDLVASPNSGPGGGSDDVLTSGGSDDVPTLEESSDSSGSGSSGSGSSGPGSGSDDPEPTTQPLDDH
jgi:RNA polymerase sigma factor (sigma-70 family)